MSHCKNCRWSEPYFRGLLCRWVENHDLPKLPPYLKIAGTGFAGLESSYPWMLDQQDYPNCRVFEPANTACSGQRVCTCNNFVQEPDGKPGECGICGGSVAANASR